MKTAFGSKINNNKNSNNDIGNAYNNDNDRGYIIYIFL